MATNEELGVWGEQKFWVASSFEEQNSEKRPSKRVEISLGFGKGPQSEYFRFSIQRKDHPQKKKHQMDLYPSPWVDATEAFALVPVKQETRLWSGHVSRALGSAGRAVCIFLVVCAFGVVFYALMSVDSAELSEKCKSGQARSNIEEIGRKCRAKTLEDEEEEAEGGDIRAQYLDRTMKKFGREDRALINFGREILTYALPRSSGYLETILNEAAPLLRE